MFLIIVSLLFDKEFHVRTKFLVTSVTKYFFYDKFVLVVHGYYSRINYIRIKIIRT
jgi:hypothetical protein